MKLDSVHKSIVSRIPSLQDLISAVAMFQIGKPSVIYPEEGGYVLIKPAHGKTPKINAETYNKLVKEALSQNNIDILVNGLRDMGFDISGEADGKFGKGDPKLQSQVKQFGSQVPTATGKEVGGVSTRGERGARATELKRIGTPDHVEIEVPYDPKKVKPIEALDDIDDTFVFHTHPKMADNNYFPGKMQKR
ncbi:MAG: hypothetical protein GF411_20470 [Candidatus Lokiarchaeota archaeon]|nr:hypothetical protein [Candidatus Lokiarchaeota archaeon]